MKKLIILFLLFCSIAYAGVTTTGVFTGDSIVAPIKELTTLTYTSQYPPAYNSTYVVATSTLGTYYPYQAVNPANSLVDGASTSQWYSGSNNNTNQRFHIDLGSPKIITRIYIENGHQSGGSLTEGVKNFTFWGSNTAGDATHSGFNDVTWGDDSAWTQLTTSPSIILQHMPVNASYPQYFSVTNLNSYRYYALKFSDCNGNSSYMSVRRIELQSSSVAAPVSVLDNSNHTLKDQDGNTALNFYNPKNINLGTTFLTTAGFGGSTADNGSLIILPTTSSVLSSSYVKVCPLGGKVSIGATPPNNAYLAVYSSNADNSGFSSVNSPSVWIGSSYGLAMGYTGGATFWLQAGNGNATYKSLLSLQPNGANISAGSLTSSSLFSITQQSNGPGVVSCSSGGNIVTGGLGTTFTTTFKVGDNITLAGESAKTIASITSDTSLTITGTFSGNRSSVLYTTNNTGIRFLVGGNGRSAFNGVIPSAVLTLPAGAPTAGLSPLKFTAGTNLTIAETGAIEYDGTHFFATPTGTLRENIPTGSKGSGILAASTSTTIIDSVAKTSSVILIQSTSSSLMALNPYISIKNNGSFVISHLSAAGTETFDYIIVN